MPYDTQDTAFTSIVLVSYTTKKRGYLPSARLLVRPTTALQVGEQCDTHAKVMLIHPIVCDEGIVSLLAHTTEYTISAYPWHHTPLCL